MTASTEYDCRDGQSANGMGEITRTTLEGCKQRFAGTGYGFIYYADSAHCQRSGHYNIQSKSWWMFCPGSDPLMETEVAKSIAVDEESAVGWAAHRRFGEDCNYYHKCVKDLQCKGGSCKLDREDSTYNQWYDGWCEASRGEDQNSGESNLGRGFKSLQACLYECNKKPFTACEYTKKKRQCIRHTQPVTSASNNPSYFCYIPDPKTLPTSMTPSTEYDCRDGQWANGMGEITRTTLEGCKQRFAGTGQGFIYYADSAHCQRSGHYNIQSKSWWMFCPGSNPNDEAYEAAYETVAMTHEHKDFAHGSRLVNVMAALGLAVTAYGAFRHYVK